MSSIIAAEIIPVISAERWSINISLDEMTHMMFVVYGMITVEDSAFKKYQNVLLHIRLHYTRLEKKLTSSLWSTDHRRGDGIRCWIHRCDCNERWWCCISRMFMHVVVVVAIIVVSYNTYLLYQQVSYLSFLTRCWTCCWFWY